MAKVTEIRLMDDLDGGEANETVEFSIDGRGYTIDLSDVHAEQLRDAFAPFTAAARRTGGRAKAGRAGQHVVKSAVKRDPKAIRAWAHENNIEVAERGRIPAPVIEAYMANVA